MFKSVNKNGSTACSIYHGTHWHAIGSKLATSGGARENPKWDLGLGAIVCNTIFLNSLLCYLDQLNRVVIEQAKILT